MISQPVNAERKSVRFVEHSLQPNVKIENLTNSVVIYSNVSGTVTLENISNSKIIVGCHQCVVKNCQDVEIWLDRCATPTIEASNRLVFVLPLSCHKVLVNDFSWSQDGVASPNYHIINSGNCDYWKAFTTMTEEDLDKIGTEPKQVLQ